MTWTFPHRMLACYSMLPIVHEWPTPRLLEACSPWRHPSTDALAARRGYRLTVCDLEPRGEDVDCQDICKLMYPSDAFRGVISSDTLEHVEDMNKALGELFDVTESGGFAIICLPICFMADGTKRKITERAEADHPNHHVWSPGMDVEDRMRAVGYAVTGRFEGLNFKQFPMSALWLLEKPC